MNPAAALLLGFAAGTCAPALLDRLREHRRMAAGLPDLLGWLHLVAPGTILQKSGSFLTGWSYRGPDLAAATPEELDALAGHLNDALLPYGEGWMFHVDLVRRPAQGYAPPGAFPDPVTRWIDDERRAAYEAAHGHFVSESFLVATYLPPREAYSKVAALFIQGRPRARSAWADLHRRFEDEAAQLERRLSRPIRRSPGLGSRQLLTHLHASLTGLAHPVEPPPHGAYLDSLLADRALAAGWAPKIGDLHSCAWIAAASASHTPPSPASSTSSAPWASPSAPPTASSPSPRARRRVRSPACASPGSSAAAAPAPGSAS